jgi:hypothetical protein
MKIPLKAVWATMIFAPSVSLAAGYQFIISGDPVASATSKICKSASIGISLNTSVRSCVSSSTSLEARYRTIGASQGIKIRTDKTKGMIIKVM